MTDKSDVAALRPSERAKLGFVTDDDTGGYYVAECEECGNIFPSQTCDGGEQIADSGDYGDCYCPHCGFIDPLECDNANLVWNVQQLKIVNLTKQLEAERQQRETADRSAAAERLLRKASDKAFNEQLERAEAAEKERDDLKSAHGNMVTRCALLRQRTDLPVDRVPAYIALVKAQEEISALKDKLANPVVLPAGYSTRNGHPFHEGERNVMIPNKHGDWLSRFDVEHAIHVAGFKVECGETHQQKPGISKEKLCDWLEDNFDIDESQRDAFANCFAHHCNCIVKDGE